MSQKEIRKQRAAEREKFAPRMRELKKRIEEDERKVDELQAKLDEASKELFNPTPTTDFATLNRAVRDLQDEIDRRTESWEAASEELERVRAEAAS